MLIAYSHFFHADQVCRTEWRKLRMIFIIRHSHLKPPCFYCSPNSRHWLSFVFLATIGEGDIQAILLVVSQVDGAKSYTLDL